MQSKYSFDRISDWWFQWVMFLPYSLVENRPTKWVRVVCFLMCFPWVLVVAAPSIPVLLVCLFWSTLEDL